MDIRKESRLMAAPSRLERYMLKLINADRADAGLKPLDFDRDLNEAAEKHSGWMLEADRFSHTGQGGSDPEQRMDAAGYDFTGEWSWGENVAWTSSHSPQGYKDEVRELHQDLMNSPEHRANILDGDFTEIGIGMEIGDFSGQSSVFVTQDFAHSGDGTDFI
jgi:serralysin